MGSMRGADASHFLVGPSKHVNIIKKNLSQLFFFLFRQEGADVRMLIRSAQEY